jgi:hypothetical protein
LFPSNPLQSAASVPLRQHIPLSAARDPVSFHVESHIQLSGWPRLSEFQGAVESRLDAYT